MQDTFGRTIDYLRISITDRCNFRCIYCMPPEGVVQMSHMDILRYNEIVDIAKIAAEAGVKHIRLTGGEPTVRKGLVDLVRDIHDIPGIESVAMTTNGMLLPRMAQDLKEAGLSRVNISLDTLDPQQFTMITRCGHVEDVIAGIHAALDAGLTPVKINAVAVRSLNQDFLQFAKMTIDKPLHVRFIEYMPVGEGTGIDGAGWGESDVISAEEILEKINTAARAEGMPELLPCNAEAEGWGPARYYKFEGAMGTVGFISAMSNHFCSTCNRVRLSADGKMRACLFSDEETDIKTALREGGIDAARAAFAAAVNGKPEEHFHKVGTKRKMSQIGG